ncbi:MAG: hypothetical protein AAFQ14_07270 [Cyanobacteria bacterium J06621_12]
MNKIPQQISVVIASVVFIASLSFAMNYLVSRLEQSPQQQKDLPQEATKSCAVI